MISWTCQIHIEQLINIYLSYSQTYSQGFGFDKCNRPLGHRTSGQLTFFNNLKLLYHMYYFNRHKNFKLSKSTHIQNLLRYIAQILSLYTGECINN